MRAELLELDRIDLQPVREALGNTLETRIPQAS